MGEGVGRQEGGVEQRRRFNFFRESWGELKKVEWPDQRAVISGTSVVLIACAIVGAFLYVADQALSRIVKQLI